MLATMTRAVLPAWERISRPATATGAIARSQSRILARLLRKLSALPVGRALRLDQAAGALDPARAFRELVPLTQYADYADLIDRVARGEPGVMFRGRAVALAQTSGTTRGADAGERYVPQNRELIAHHRRGGSAALARLLSEAGAGVLDGRLLMLGGSTALSGTPIPAGDLSGICAGRLPRWIASHYEPGPEIAAIADWRERLARIAERTSTLDVRLVAGIPSWLLVLFRAIAEHRGFARARVAWPHLGALVHGGHSIEPFVAPLAEHLPGDALLLEVYPASEAFIAIGERPWRLAEGRAPDLSLLTAHGVYLEFCPPGGGAADCRGAHELERGGLYRVLVTTPGGLVRYEVGDLVLATGEGRIRFAGRSRARISVFGEHVEGYALAEALGDASAATGATVRQYHVAPILPTAAQPCGRHEWLVEFERAPRDLGAFAERIDRHLASRVLDYAAHRAGDGQLLAPTVRALPAGTFEAYLAESGKLDGQRKVPQAWPDRSVAARLIDIAERAQGAEAIPELAARGGEA
jgi:hypothetical protein